MGLLIGFVLKWMRTAHSITAERYFQETNILCGVSVVEQGCSWSRTPGFISSGEFSSLLVSLLWDLNQLMATGEGLQRTRQTLELAVSQLAGVNVPIICFEASRLVYHSAAWLHCEKGCSHSPTRSRDVTQEAAPAAPAVMLLFPQPGRNKQLFQLELRRCHASPSSDLAHSAVQHNSALELTVRGCWGC